MNLYAIKFEHYSQKDSQIGIVAYAIAKNDESIYEFIKLNPHLDEHTYISTSWEDNENDGKEYDVYDDKINWIGTQSFKEHIIEVQGEMNSEYANYDDLYYGKTYYGWKLIKENIQEYQIKALIETIGLVVIEEGVHYDCKTY